MASAEFIWIKCLKPSLVASLEAMCNDAWRSRPNKGEPSTVLSFLCLLKSQKAEGSLKKVESMCQNPNLPRGFEQPELWAGMGVCRCFDLTNCG